MPSILLFCLITRYVYITLLQCLALLYQLLEPASF